MCPIVIGYLIFTMKKYFLLILLSIISLCSYAQADGFSIEPISDAVKARIFGKSYPKIGARISLADLRYLRVLHYDADGKVKKGEIIVNKAIANDVIAVFKELYKIKYPIESMKLIDEYDAVDEISMRHNNTSGFCYRVVKGSNSLSKHSRGMAVDINPLFNPCFSVDLTGKTAYKKGTLQPANAEKYVDRTKKYPYTLTAEVIAIFKKYGFRWGGDWRTKKDYQHFEK